MHGFQPQVRSFFSAVTAHGYHIAFCLSALQRPPGTAQVQVLVEDSGGEEEEADDEETSNGAESNKQQLTGGGAASASAPVTKQPVTAAEVAGGRTRSTGATVAEPSVTAGTAAPVSPRVSSQASSAATASPRGSPSIALTQGCGGSGSKRRRTSEFGGGPASTGAFPNNR